MAQTGYDEYDDEDLDDEAFDEDAWSDDELDNVVTCPHCGEEVYAESQQCPSCRMWLTVRDRYERGTEGVKRRLWWWVAVVLFVVIFLVWGVSGW